MALVIAVALGVISEIPDWTLPSPQNPGWTPLIGLFHALVIGATFGLIVLAAMVLTSGDRQTLWPRSLRRSVLAFLLFAVGDFVVELSMRPFSSNISGYSGLQHTIGRIVEAGRGFAVPLVLLAVFLGVILVRRYRSQ